MTIKNIYIFKKVITLIFSYLSLQLKLLLFSKRLYTLEYTFSAYKTYTYCGYSIAKYD